MIIIIIIIIVRPIIARVDQICKISLKMSFILLFPSKLKVTKDFSLSTYEKFDMEIV